jgi:hypothetical protein
MERTYLSFEHGPESIFIETLEVRIIISLHIFAVL